ncbi:MAG: molybdate ABC transporter permease subunit [Pseudanabaenaceae cyanobacterium bins.68]|nr:molybdate ABC transporter permease subunit [Pseudanabaenaceae cyanobacterium bins.68]
MSLNFAPLWISLKVTVVSASITFGLGTAIAYWIYRYKGRGKSVIEGILLMPLVLPPTVVGFLLLILLGKSSLIGQIFALWDFRLVFTWYAAVLAAVVIALPLMFRSALGAFEQIDSLLLDAARVEGASELEVFWYIALPLAMRGILAGLVLSLMRILGEFGATLVVAGNIPDQTQTIPMAIYFAVEAGATAESWLWVMVILIVALGAIFSLNLLRP